MSSAPLLTGEDIDRYAQLAGPIGPEPDGSYKVQYRRIPGSEPVRSFLVAIFVLMVEVGFLVWLVGDTSHYPEFSSSPLQAMAQGFMMCSIFLLALFQVQNITTLCLATFLGRYPVPVPAPKGLKLAFVVAWVPKNEPIEMVEQTLRAALDIEYPSGTIDVWLLNEGTDNPILQRRIDDMNERLGPRFHIFSRKGIPAYNQASGPFKEKCKAGNYNAWFYSHGGNYDIFMSVDCDHVPVSDHFLDQIVGYFHDPDVAFVVGPQVYRNYDNIVTKCAESQQFIFHSKVQPMGNYFGGGVPMLVGTNNAFRVSALLEIGGLRDSVTEDMATSLMFHAHGWKSVYTPSVLAYGEGPSAWTDMFSQQDRWSGGTFAALKGDFWRCLRRMPMGARLHYFLIISYYPSAAIGWIIGALNCCVYMVSGQTSIQVSSDAWRVIFAFLVLVQVALYDYNRKHNVSPFEKKESSGAAGMLMSILCAPIYAASFVKSLVGVDKPFKVTPKGASSSPDRLKTFAHHIGWATVLVGCFAVSVWQGHTNLGMLTWVPILVTVCLLPIVLWRYENRKRKRRRLEPAMHSTPPVFELEQG